jgi:hypothetical protein
MSTKPIHNKFISNSNSSINHPLDKEYRSIVKFKTIIMTYLLIKMKLSWELNTSIKWHIMNGSIDNYLAILIILSSLIKVLWLLKIIITHVQKNLLSHLINSRVNMVFKRKSKVRNKDQKQLTNLKISKMKLIKNFLKYLKNMKRIPLSE